MKLPFLTVLICCSFFANAHQEPSTKAQDPETKINDGVSIVPVYTPSKEAGIVAIRIPLSLIQSSIKYTDEQMKALLRDDELGLQYDYRYTVKDSRGFKLKVTGIGIYSRSRDPKEREAVWVYLNENLTEMPSVSLWLDRKTVQLVKNGPLPSEFDPAAVSTPSSFRLLGFQPAAQLIGGGTAAAYQVAVDLSIGDRGRISGIGSTSFLDQQAQFTLGYRVPLFGDTQVDVLTNQLGTNQMLQIGKESVSRQGSGVALNYLGEVAPLTTYRSGLYFARQLRVDPRVGGPNARLGSGMYFGSTSRTEARFLRDGFDKFSFGTGLYLFPFGADNQFGTRWLEISYDLGLQLALRRPKKLKNGFSNDALWLKLGYFGGIQPGNAFNQVQGFRFDIVRSF